MITKKHKRKINHVLIFTSDAVDAKVRQLNIKPWLVILVTVMLSVFIGIAIGYIIYVDQIWNAINQKNIKLQALTDETQVQNAELASEIEGLNNKIRILSETVNQKVVEEQELTAQLDKQTLPTEFPLTGSASIEEVAEGEPISIFTASVGSMVVATASGVVETIEQDEEYGYKMTINHGNGYITIYRNKGEAVLKAGDSVVQGTTLFLIGEDNLKLGYQMKKDDVYINPMSMLEISG